MTSFKRTQRKYVQKAYRVRNWREYETGLRARGSLTVGLGLTDGKLANWNSPRPTRRKPGRQRKYSNHAIETTVTLGLVFGLASRQTEGFLRSLLTLLSLDNDVPDHSTISRRKARLGKVASYERRTVKPVHLLIDSSGLSVHVGQLRTPPKARDYRKLHLAVDEQTSDVVACALTSKRARDRPIRISGRRESGIAACPALVEFDQLFIQMQILDHRTHLEVEPLSKHLVRPVLWPLLFIGQPTVQHRREQLRPEVLQNLAFRLGVLIFRQEVHVRRGSQVLEDALGDVGGVVLLGPCEVGWQRSDDHSRSMDDAHRYAARA